MSDHDDYEHSDEVVEEEEGGSAALKKLREKLAVAIKEKQEYLEGWQRSRADFANLKREETEREKDREVRLKRDFILALIPSLDALEAAMHSTDFLNASPEWKSGLEGLKRELLKLMEQYGASSFHPLNEPFNPHEHEAVCEVHTDAQEKDHTVASVERSGYRQGDRVIRPAQVSVNLFKQ